jgi:hypothetical protein
MISHKYRCIFVHVPKTAGQSVEKLFLDLHHLSWRNRAPLLLRHNPDPARGPERLAHLTAAQYVEQRYVDADTFERYFKFSFVRNPWDRLVSEYRYLELEGRMPFSDFVEKSFARTDKYSNASLHIMPQTIYLTDRAGNYLVDFVGRFETLAFDFDRVARALKLPKSKLAHRNVSSEAGLAALYRRLLGKRPTYESKKPYQDYYSQMGLKEEVERFYAEDIARFGYGFDGTFPSGPIVPSHGGEMTSNGAQPRALQ